MKQGFLPVYDHRTEILILGTAPGVVSLKKQQYYANPGNQFWRIIFTNLAIDDPIDYQKRIAYLKEHRIGLWDVYEKFERKGSLDINFTTVIPNDFKQILTKAPVKLIIANGKLAHKEALKNQTIQHLPIITVPSTSGANNGMSKERLIAWREALAILKN